MTPVSDNTRGALLMMASMTSFTVGDACMKLLGHELPLAQILTLRGAVASLFIFAMARSMRQLRFDLPLREWRLILIRSCSEMAATFFFLTALIHLPLANVSALMQSLPLTVTLGSALFFSEPVGWRRWAAIAVGFLGMLLIVQPGVEGMNIYMLYTLFAVLFVTVRDLVTRSLSPQTPTLTVTFCAAVGVFAYASIWSLGSQWAPLNGRSGLLLMGASLCIIGGYTFSIMTMRIGSVAVSAPFRYTSLIVALVLGWIIFEHWPSAVVMTGAAIIVATGLYTLWRESRLSAENTDRT